MRRADFRLTALFFSKAVIIFLRDRYSLRLFLRIPASILSHYMISILHLSRRRHKNKRRSVFSGYKGYREGNLHSSFRFLCRIGQKTGNSTQSFLKADTQQPMAFILKTAAHSAGSKTPLEAAALPITFNHFSNLLRKNTDFGY